MIGYQRERLHHLLHMAERFLSGEADSLGAARDLEREAGEMLAPDAELAPLAERLCAALPRDTEGRAASGEPAGAGYDPERVRPHVRELRDALARRLP